MKRLFTIVFAISVLQNTAVLAQTPEIKTDLPQVAPPSPTVAGFMKFEEVPVNNYTGIPDISIPLYSIASHSPEIGVNISLKYHPSSIAVEEQASYVGLGWSLFGGGTISRTVRGLPDDLLYHGSNRKQNRYGIYQTEYNKYYDVMALLGSQSTTQAQNEMRSQFYWDAYENGSLDTEHDLYQFNFMGYSGRFIISKQSGLFEVQKLDNDNAIQITYNDANKTFTLFDPKGYEYIFDVKEETSQYTFSQYTYFNSDNPDGTSHTITYPFNSAFHLSKIKDRNGNLLVEYVFNPDNELITEQDIDITTIKNAIINPVEGYAISYIENYGCGMFKMIEPRLVQNHNQRATKTKKIKQIKVTDKAKIDFTLVADRQDTENTGSHRLSEIIIRDWNNTAIKKFTLQYSYSQVNNNKRMILDKVTESNPAGTTSVSYEMDYTPAAGLGNYSKDYWGYFTSKPLGYPTDFEEFRDASRVACKVDALQKMRLPSGGAIVFNFESNTYSYIGDEPVTDFTDNPDNYTYSPDYTGTMTSTGGSIVTYTITSSTNLRYAKFMPSIISGTPGIFRLYKVVGSSDVEIISFNCGDNGTSCSYTPEIELLANTTYKIKYNVFNITGSHSGAVSCYYRTPTVPQLEYIYGGGIRIKNIGYFDDGAVNQKYYDGVNFQDDFIPSKQKNYDYSFFSNPNKSSGSLVFAKPDFEYPIDKHYYWKCWPEDGQTPPWDFTIDLRFKTVTSYNNLKVLRTHGADVGYQNVKVWETGNGYTRYEYISPIDVPEDNYALGYPFLASKNFDYKRGQLKKQWIYNQNGDLQQETTNEYTTEETNRITGFSISSSNNCRYSYLYSTHSLYYAKVHECATNGTYTFGCNNICGYPVEYINVAETRDYYGWTKLASTITKEYLTGSTVETKETFTYNTTNKQIASQTTEIYDAAETVKADYFYNSFPYNNIGSISRIENRRNGALVDTQKMLYSVFPGNASYLPATVQTAKSQRTFENRVQFVKYDEFGNLLEAKKENGASIVYIWGYNKTLPIAMVENATYASISPTLITNAQTQSNGTSEALLVDALNALRAGLPNAMVTTYIHKPLIGVTNITDPKGDKTTFEYDTLGRLKAVRDKDNNLLSENEYNYKMP